MDTLDLLNRDPNAINNHVQVAFEDVLAEPAGIHSFECIWKTSYMVFECGKNFQYQLLAFLSGPCLALAWGCQFGATAFVHIWTFTPLLRTCSIECALWQKMYGVCISCCCAPCFDLIGGACARIKTG